MSKDFDVVYPKRGRIELTGGLNNKGDRHEIADIETPDCLNVVFGDRTVETRGGSDVLNSSVGSYAGEGLYTRNDRSGTQTMCAWWNGSLYTLAGSTFTTVASAQSIFTAGGRVGATEYENYIYFGNGGVNPYKWNGAEFTTQGIKQPSGPTAATAPTGTNLTGDYRYKVTYVNSASVEGNPSSATATFTAASEDIRVTIPTAPASHGVAARRIYRTEAGGSTYKRVAEVSDNTTTTYDDAIADGSLGVSPPSDNFEPPNWSVAKAHDNRIFCNDPANVNYVWYSNLADPYTFGATNFLRVGDDSGDTLVSVETYDNALACFCRNSVWMIHMPSTDPSTWRQVEIKGMYGSRSPYGQFRYNDKIMFPAVDNNVLVGFAAVNGLAIDPDATFLTVSSVGSLLKSERIEPEVLDYLSSKYDRITAYTYKNKAYITVAKGGSATENNRVYVYDFSMGNLLERKTEGVWAPWSGLNIEQFTEYSGTLYGQSSTANGLVYQLNTTTYNDNSSAIDSYIWTKNFSGVPGDEQEFKDFRVLGYLYEKSGAYFMDVTYRTDSDKGVGRTFQVDLDPGSTLWQTNLVWGSSTWGGGSDEGEEERYLGNARGKRLQMKFSNQNTANQKFKILGVNYGYNRKGRR